MPRRNLTMISALLASFFPLPVQAAEIQRPDPVDPHFYIEGTIITLSGRVAAVNGDEFTLDYGNGSITVTMDDSHFFRDSAEEKVVPGETVTVSGMIDGGPFRRREIDAGGIYVHDRSVHYYSRFEEKKG